MAELRLEGGGEFEMGPPRFSVGRAPQNDLVLKDRTVSRCHAIFSARSDGWHIVDLGSHNNTLLNGLPVLTAKLRTGDQIRLGNCQLAFADGATAEAAEDQPDVFDGAVTQTIRLSDLTGVTPTFARDRRAPADADRRLSHLLALAELAVSVRSLPALFDGVVRALRSTLAVDRVIPIWEDASHTLQAYVESGPGFSDDLASLNLHVPLARECRRDGVAAAWRGEGDHPNIACAPMRVGVQSHGLLYCDRRDPTAEFTGCDLTYLLAVAMQAGLAVENVLCYERMARTACSLTRRLAERFNMVGESEQMQEVYRLIRKVAPTDAGVLICGESGTGKEMVARAVHRHSRRRDGPLEIVNCAAVPPTLLESELFGHVRGAFTGAVADRPGRFELADGGTLFLDEVVELPVECQTMLLRALEQHRVRRVGDTADRAVDARLIAATNQPLAAALAEKRLREDLFYRLDRLRIEVPPLRERSGDIVLLAEHFLDEFVASLSRRLEGFSPGVLELFRSYDWPGNVRELRNVVERMVLLAEGSVLQPDDVPVELREAVRRSRGAAVEPLCEVERAHIMCALQAAGGNKTRAAQMLGIDRSTLYARLRSYEAGQ